MHLKCLQYSQIDWESALSDVVVCECVCDGDDIHQHTEKCDEKKPSKIDQHTHMQQAFEFPRFLVGFSRVHHHFHRTLCAADEGDDEQRESAIAQ